MEELIKEVLKKNKQYLREQIEFTEYCKGKLKERLIAEETIMSINLKPHSKECGNILEF